MRYAAVIGEDIQETVRLLESEPQKPEVYSPAAGIMPVAYSKEKKPRRRKTGSTLLFIKTLECQNDWILFRFCRISLTIVFLPVAV